MKKFKIPTKYIIIGVTVICAGTIFLSSKLNLSTQETFIEKSLGYIVTPIQSVLTKTNDWVSNTIEGFRKLKELQAENQRLTNEVERLNYENNILKIEAKNYENLRQLYQLDEKYVSYPKVGAQVIGKSPGNWYNIFVIDKGSDDGLQPNMVVLAGNGLAGHIIETGPNYSKVLSIIDDTGYVHGKVLRSADTVGISGSKELAEIGECKIEYIDQDTDIIVGDEIVTSELSSIFPPGIVIGIVKEIKQESNEITKVATLEPVVDFKHISEVLVINKIWKENLNLEGILN